MNNTTTVQEQAHRFKYEWRIADGYPAPGIKKNGLKVFSCFSCGGGSSFGYKLAGYDVIGCNEIDPRMMEVYKLNHNPKYSYLESIVTFKDRNDLPKELYELDILDGSPPCSSFSMAGNREKDWGKEKKFKEGQAKQVLDTLFFDFIDLAEKLQPKVVIAENVKGLLQGGAKKYVREIYKAFDKAGYLVQHFLLDASKMGVPQRRERVFFIAMRKDLAAPFLYYKDMFTCIPKLEFDFDEPEILFGNIYAESQRKPISPAIKDSYDYCMNNKHSDFAQYYEVNFNKRKYFNTRLIFKDRVCDTIKSDCEHIIEGTESYISETEIILCGSYPLDYNFNGKKPDYFIGMSVPPVMTAQIAHQIYTQWLSNL